MNTPAPQTPAARSAPADRNDKPVNGDGRYDRIDQELGRGEGRVIHRLAAPDIFIDGSPHDTRFIAGPRGRLDARIDLTQWSAMRAGFTLALRFDGQERIIDGLALAVGTR
jgi:hypothetical protein